MDDKQKEADFLDNIANRLGRSRLTGPPVQPVRGVPGFWRNYQLDAEQKIELFMKNWEGYGGVAKRFSSAQALCSYIAEVARSFEAKRIIREDHPLFASMQLDGALSEQQTTVWQEHAETDLLGAAAQADIGIAIADFAIAHTGTIVMTSAATRGRSISLLPTMFMAIIPAATMKTRMGEVLQEINKWNGGSMPAGIHFITGPSRSADIENDLTIGVHGPGIVHALVLDEEMAHD